MLTRTAAAAVIATAIALIVPASSMAQSYYYPPPGTACPAGVVCQPNAEGGLNITGTVNADAIVGTAGRDIVQGP
jgi:CRISPR/Cas system-associated protein Cas5 (RAMP superfamily)